MSDNGGKKSNDAGSYDYVQGLTWDSADEIAIFLHIDSSVSSRRGFGRVFALTLARIQIFWSAYIRGRHTASANAQLQDVAQYDIAAIAPTIFPFS